MRANCQCLIASAFCPEQPCALSATSTPLLLTPATRLISVCRLHCLAAMPNSGLTFEVVRSSVSVKQRRVLVTGGANGIGAHIVHRFLNEGCQVAILDNDAEALEKFKMLLMAAWEGFDVDKVRPSLL